MQRDTELLQPFCIRTQQTTPWRVTVLRTRTRIRPGSPVQGHNVDHCIRDLAMGTLRRRGCLHWKDSTADRWTTVICRQYPRIQWATGTQFISWVRWEVGVCSILWILQWYISEALDCLGLLKKDDFTLCVSWTIQEVWSTFCPYQSAKLSDKWDLLPFSDKPLVERHYSGHLPKRRRTMVQ